MKRNFKLIPGVLCLFLFLLSGCSSSKDSDEDNLLPDEPDPVTWIKQDGIKYYYFPSDTAINEKSLYYTDEKTDSDDAVELGQKIYKNDNVSDSLYIKNESDGSWLQYKSRDTKNKF